MKNSEFHKKFHRLDKYTCNYSLNMSSWLVWNCHRKLLPHKSHASSLLGKSKITVLRLLICQFQKNRIISLFEFEVKASSSHLPGLNLSKWQISHFHSLLKYAKQNVLLLLICKLYVQNVYSTLDLSTNSKISYFENFPKWNIDDINKDYYSHVSSKFPNFWVWTGSF